MQTILGAGGVIGRELAKTLPQYTDKIRLVNRNPKKVNPGDETFACDLTNGPEVMQALEGTRIAYLTAGLPYNYKVWRELWPKVMKNVIAACETHGAKLVFFDNVYMYDPEHIPHMTEQTPVNPSSKKGMVRAEIARMLMEGVEKGRLSALIARSADFYGPGNENSVLQETVYKNLKKGKKANWFCSLDEPHSFTYTPDAGKATALLGNTAEAYDQVWHLPTDPNILTGREWVRLFARELGVQPRVQLATKFVLRIMGLFIPIIRESYEMLYQYDRKYFFDSSKFNRHFDFKPTTYEEGVKAIVASDKG